MSDWAESRLQDIIRNHLKTCLERRPYRRLIVGDGSTCPEGGVSLTVTADHTRSGGENDCQLWTCELSLELEATGARHGIDNFLELVDLMHEADIDGGDLVIIQILFREARLIDETDERDAHRILSSFDIVTMDDRKAPLKQAPEAVLASSA